MAIKVDMMIRRFDVVVDDGDDFLCGSSTESIRRLVSSLVVIVRCRRYDLDVVNGCRRWN